MVPSMTGKSNPETGRNSGNGPANADADAGPTGARSGGQFWWVIPNFSHLVIWWLVIIGYYVVFNSLSVRYHKGLIDAEMVVEGWYVILASGAIGALYAKKLKMLWFLISLALALLMLLAMLLCLGALKALMSP